MYDYSNEDHIITAGSDLYVFDADGFLVDRVSAAGTTPYDYSLRGELLSVDLADGRSVTYDHDPMGRRIAKKIDGTVVEKYLWQDNTMLLAVYDGSDNLAMRFNYADGRLPISMLRGGVTYYMIYDQVGSLRLIVDSSGNITKRIDYDSFGNIINDTNSGFAIPFGFGGGLHDRDTGLVRFGVRDFDPGIGRWTAKDPIDFAGGDVNLYGYVQNNSVNFVDPSGLLNIVVGGSGSFVANKDPDNPIAGVEGGCGVVINPGLGESRADIGLFSFIGKGGGFNIGADVFFGLLKGQSVSGHTVNLNFVIGPVRVSIVLDKNGRNFQGIVVGVGPAVPLGFSATESITREVTIRK